MNEGDVCVCMVEFPRTKNKQEATAVKLRISFLLSQENRMEPSSCVRVSVCRKVGKRVSRTSQKKKKSCVLSGFRAYYTM